MRKHLVQTQNFLFVFFFFCFQRFKLKRLLKIIITIQAVKTNISSLSANHSSVVACRKIISLCMENDQNVDIRNLGSIKCHIFLQIFMNCLMLHEVNISQNVLLFRFFISFSYAPKKREIFCILGSDGHSSQISRARNAKKKQKQ